MYEYNGKPNIDNIFSWAPNEEQWWITGFNPDYAGKVDYKKQITIGIVDCSEPVEMYKKLQDTSYVYGEYNEEAAEYLMFDDSNHIVWSVWSEN